MKRLSLFLGLLLALLVLLGACQPTAQQTEEAATPETATEEMLEEEIQTEDAGPHVGGTVVVAITGEPISLDPQFIMSGVEGMVGSYLNAALVKLDPYNSGGLVPYLAKSWEISEDGKVITFTLRDDVLFHNGEPLTAQDYAWTFQRAMQGTPAFQLISKLQSAEALDDYTLQLTLSAPDYLFLYAIGDEYRFGPLKQSIVESTENYGHNHIGVGPYKLKEWATGEKVVVERNPDYVWAPEPFRQGPYYIENIEFRIITESAIIIAGLETGELDYAGIEAKDVELIESLGTFNIYSPIQAGLSPYIAFNWSRSPFDDVLVRRALSMAVDKDAIVQILTQGQAEVQHGPFSSTMLGYWDGVEELGYKFDLEGARELMAEAGWTDSDGDGILDKDGEPLSFQVNVASNYDPAIKIGELVQEQYKQLGADVELLLQEHALNIDAVTSGDFDTCIYSLLALYPDWILTTHNSKGYNIIHTVDPELDRFAEALQTTMDADERQQLLIDFQKYYIDQAIGIPLYAPKTFQAFSKRQKGIIFSPVLDAFYFNDAYLVGE